MAEFQGIDVSKHQGGILWPQVKEAGIQFAILRAGYGREVSQKDVCFEENYKNAKAAGIPVGAYWYSYAVDAEDAKKEAAACLACIKGKTFEYPIAYDVEDHSQAGFDKQKLTDIVTAFCEELEAAGYYVMVYANKNWLETKLDYERLKQYDIWLAQWADEADWAGDYGIWQYSNQGAVDGIDGRVDLDIAYKDYPDIIKGAGLDGFSEEASAPVTPPDTNVDVIYCVRAGGKWYPEVKNLTDFAGVIGKAITDIAIKVSKGSIKYRVHVKGGNWLPWVTGYNLNDAVNGYAGNGQELDAVEVYYYTPSDIRPVKKAKYRVSPVKGGYWPWQYDDETTDGQDGYAGVFGKKIDRFQIVIE